MAEAERLRLALFSGNYNNVRDGANRALNRLTQYLLSRNVDVKVFSPTIANPAFEPAGELHSLPSIPLPKRREYRLAYRIGPHSRKVLDEFDPHLVHISAPDITAGAAKRYAQRNGKIFVASFHTHFESYLDYYHLTVLKPVLHRIYRGLYNACAHVYSPSPIMEKHLRACGVTAPIRRWTRGIDCSIFSPEHRSNAWRKNMGLTDGVPTIVFVGRLVKEKGLGMLIRIAKKLSADGYNYQLLIVGDGPEGDAIKAALPQAIYTGHLERGELATAYASGDIFLNPSDTEAFGNVTQEAMASGIACVCSDAGGSTDIVKHASTGFLAQARDLESHVRFTKMLLDDAQLRKDMGVKSRQAALQRTWNEVMAELFSHYEELLSERLPDRRFAYTATENE